MQLASGTAVAFAWVADAVGWATAFSLLAVPVLVGWWILRPVAVSELIGLTDSRATA
jgi:hypothetical protein